MSLTKNTLTFFCLLIPCGLAWSAQYHYQFTGTYEIVAKDVTSISLNDSWKASFFIETNTTGTTTTYPDPSSPNALSGDVTIYSNMFGNIAINDELNFAFTEGDVRVADNFELTVANGQQILELDAVSFNTFDNIQIDDYVINQIGILFQQYTTAGDQLTATTSTDLIESADLSQFPVTQFGIYAGISNSEEPYQVAFGRVDTFRVSEVPLPAAAWLLGSGIFGLISLKLSQTRKGRTKN